MVSSALPLVLEFGANVYSDIQRRELNIPFIHPPAFAGSGRMNQRRAHERRAPHRSRRPPPAQQKASRPAPAPRPPGPEGERARYRTRQARYRYAIRRVRRDVWRARRDIWPHWATRVRTSARQASLCASWWPQSPIGWRTSVRQARLCASLSPIWGTRAAH